VSTNNSRARIDIGMNQFFTLLIAVAALIGSLFAARAQPQTASKPPAVATSNFQDWLVRCPAGPQTGPCDAVQLLIEPKSKQRVLSISVAYETTKGQHVVRIVLPLGVWLPNGVTIVAGKTKIEKVVVRRCEPFGCVVEGLLDAKLREALRAGGEAKIVVFDQNKKPLDLKFSLKGYVEAEDYMVAQTKKAKPAAAPAPVAPADP
jgi:invasion protein IalB